MEWEKLIIEARQAAAKAYAPYSGFKVGAALLTKNGKIFTGCNVENSSYSLTVCAERTALFKAVSAGEREFSGLVIYTDDEKLFYPCGACRQVLIEFCEDIPVLIVSGSNSEERRLKDLIPDGFSLRS